MPDPGWHRKADLFAALADSSRLVILALVIDNPDITNKEVCTAVEIGQPLATYHLAVLTRAGLVRREKRTVFAHYTATLLAETVMDAIAGEVR